MKKKLIAFKVIWKLLYSSKIWKIMRLSGLLLLICTFHLLAGNSYSQNARLSIDLQQVTVAQALAEIEDQSEFYFLYNNKLIDVTRVINIKADNQSIKNILDGLFTNSNVDYIVMNRQIVLSPREFISRAETKLQSITIIGRVTDENGEPLPGVSVTVQGTTRGVLSNANGEYTIKVEDQSAVLVFSFVGYLTKEITVGDQTTINVSMELEILGLGDIVVIGYGTVRKSDLTGSVASVGGKDFNRGVITNVDQALMGKVAGMEIDQTTGEPGGGVAIRIRGAGSITAGNEPLFVIDGMPIDNSPTLETGGGVYQGSNTNPKNPLNTLNPNDIESIEVLKDASATAIYGSRGANGVILITTKQGNIGQTRVDYNFSGSIQNAEKRYDLLGAQEYMTVLNEIKEDRGEDPLFSEEDFITVGDGTDWQDQIFRTAYAQEHNLAVSGGNEKIRYFISGNYFDQESIVISNRLKRYGLRSNLDSKISDRLNISIKLSVTDIEDDPAVISNDASEFSGILSSVVFFDPTFPVKDENGNYSHSNDMLLSNPVSIAEGVDNHISTFRTMGNLALNYQITDGLSNKIQLYVDRQDVRKDTYNSTLTFEGDMRNGVARIQTLERTNIAAEYFANYKKKIGENHDIEVTAGTSYQNFEDKTQTSDAMDFPSDVLGTNNMGLGNTMYAKVNSSYTGFRLLSFFGRINYNIFEKFLFTGTFRADGSSRFGKDNKFGYFPSLALAWKLDEERFIPDLFYQLKLRMSWGTTGNQEIGNFTHKATYSASDLVAMDNRAELCTGPVRLENPNLKWETAEQFDVGLDASILKGRISGIFDFFIKNTRDLLLDLPLPQSSGFSSQLINIGGMTNRGFEANIISSNIVGKNFNWNTTLSFATLHNEVTDIGPLEMIVTGYTPESNENVSIVMPGVPLNAYYGYNITGIYQTEEEVANSAQPNSEPGWPIYEDVNGDGTVTPNDRIVLGDPFPDFTFGIRNSLNYRNISLDIFIDGKYGNELFNGTAMAQAYPRTFIRNRNAAQMRDRWTPDNPDAKWPSATEPYSYGPGIITSMFVEDASYIRLRSVQLSYSIPTKNINFLQSASIYLTGGNLLTITNYSGVNPDASLHGRSNVIVDFCTVPLARTYTLGLNVSF
jgi:TonB-linked SusC/RagA family outer membrane protein